MRRAPEPKTPRWITALVAMSFLSWVPVVVDIAIGGGEAAGWGFLLGGLMVIALPLVIVGASVVESLMCLFRRR